MKKNIIYFTNVYDSSKWTTFLKKENNLVIYDKEYKEEDKYNAFIGFFNFNDIGLLYKLLKHEISNLKFSKSESFYEMIKKYNNFTKISYLLIKEWIDFGHIDNYFIAKNILETRYFNSINIDRKRGILLKKSENKEKLIDEIKWFLKLPENLQWLIPKVYSYSVNLDDPWIKMEYYSYPTLHHIYLYGNYNLKKWDEIFNKLLFVQKEFQKYNLKLNHQEIKKTLKKIYFEKTINRLKLLKQDYEFKHFFENCIYINDKKFFTLNYIIDNLEYWIVYFKLYEIEELNIIHGDYFFANILYEPNNNIIKLVDPRGEFGGYGIYGDKYYELAKLAHSIDGMYDFIVEDIFSIEKKTNGFNYKINYEEKYNFIKHLFYSKFTNIEKNKIKFIQALLFLSMIPLHKDKPDRQKIMLGIGMEILNKLLESENIKND